MTAETIARQRALAAAKPLRRSVPPGRRLLHAFLILTTAVWLFPLLWAVYTSLRPYSDTADRGYVSLPGVLNFDNYVNAWNQAELPHYYVNTLIIVVPALVLT